MCWKQMIASCHGTDHLVLNLMAFSQHKQQQSLPVQQSYSLPSRAQQQLMGLSGHRIGQYKLQSCSSFLVQNKADGLAAKLFLIDSFCHFSQSTHPAMCIVKSHCKTTVTALPGPRMCHRITGAAPNTIYLCSMASCNEN